MDSENKLQWYVIRTKSRQEKKVAQLLSDIGFTIYIPLQTTIRQWSDRKKKVQTPYIPGYLFVQTQKSTLQAIYNIPLKISLLSEFGKNVVIRDQDIEQLKRICNHENPPPISPFKTINQGIFVEITEGPFHGFRGYVSQIKKPHLVHVQLNQLNFEIIIQTSSIRKV